MPKLSDCPQGQEDNRLPKAKRPKKNDRQPLAPLPPVLLSNRRTPCNKRPADEMTKLWQPLEKRRKLSSQDFSESGAATNLRVKLKARVSRKAKDVAGTGDKKDGAVANPRVKLKARVSTMTKAVAGEGSEKEGAAANPKPKLKAEVSTKTKVVADVRGKKSSAAVAPSGGLGKPSSPVKSKGFAFIPAHLAPVNEARGTISEPVRFTAMPISKRFGCTKAPEASAASSKGPVDEALPNSSDKGKIQDQGYGLSRRLGGLSGLLSVIDLDCMAPSELPDRKPLVSHDPRCFVLASTDDASDNARSVPQGHSTSDSSGVDLSLTHHASISAAQEALQPLYAGSDSDSEANEELSHIFGSLDL